ncbi:protein angel homolog 2 [Xiphias gladius]|uniref:protein angel homolog 2 n=1 Tax=Xiphias gladius TaxID=8245 RepID=UPI001A998115|nr:protein angel homolog 2 [Xiphias gladius]XP_039981820.1 protein angel homolog 2 [Xiphias gladius]XP_039981821.1 protein angel homolog 2 [Xiphias gladius]
MFLRWLSSFGSSFLPRSRPSLCGAGLRSSSASFTSLPPLIPAPHPCWSVRGFPPWPPQPPHAHPTARQVFAGRKLHPGNINPGNFSGNCRSLYTSAGLLMERSDRDREPPHKRRKSEEEKKSNEERGGHRGGAAGATGGKAKDGSSKREHHHLVPRVDSSRRPNHPFRDGGRDGGNPGAGKGVRRENSRDKDVERTKTGSKDRQRKDSGSRDGIPNQWRGKHQQEGHKDSQPAGSRTQTPKSRPEQGQVCMHKPTPKPNPWFKDRGAEEQGGHHRNTKGPEEWPRDRRSGGGPWTEPYPQPCGTPRPLNPWQVAAANRPPPPPGVSPPVRQQDEATPVKSLQRHWETSPACSSHPQPPGASTAFDFSVMSYNILSQQLLQDNAYLYGHCDPVVLPWEYRLPNLLAEIQQHNADILCLQEVQEDHYQNQIKPALQTLGYQCEYKKRTGRKPDGCAVIFKSSRLSLLSSHPVEFFRPGDALLDRDNVGLVVLLRPNSAIGHADPSAFVCVANTHLLYNPRRGDIKLAQLAILLAEIGRLSRLPDGSTNPVVLCGDFNSTPWSPLYRFLTTGCLDYGGLQIGMVSGQENTPRAQRLLTSPIWSHSLGINHQCQYESKPSAESPTSPTAVEGAISNLTVEDLATKAAALNRARIEHGLKLQSSYQHCLMPDGRPEITTCHSRTAMTVDYVLFTPEFPASPWFPGGRGLQLLGRLSLVGQSELEEVNGLPNRRHSSDHLPLLARFRFRH